MTTQTSGLDRDKVREFSARVVDILNGGALMYMISVGHQTGLFDAMSTLTPSTSEQVAEAAGLNERYVREWLGAMVTGRIVEHEPSTRSYWLPPEHAASLTRAAGFRNLSVTAMILTALATVEQPVVRCFQEGGGVPYAAFERFDEIMAEVSARRFDAGLLTEAVPAVDGLKQQLESGIDAADVGCGQGRAVCILAEAFPASRFVGYDFSEDAVALASAEATAKGLKNAAFEVRDVTYLGQSGRFDFITAFDAIHDQARPDLVLRGIYDALKPGGTFLCVDFAASSNLEDNMALPGAPMTYTISTMHCMTVSLALGGMGLGTVWGEQKAVEMMKAAGFVSVEVKRLPSDRVNNHYIARK
jgi:SAM-dependent methyltransferase